MGTVSCTACPTGKTSAEGSVSRDGCTDIVVVGSSQTSVVLDVVLPYSRETFTEPVQSKFRIGMAAAATAGCRCEVTKNEVIITKIQAPAAAPGTRRQTRLSAAYAGITVGVSILVPNLEAGTLLVQSGALSKEGINKELDKLQVERVTSVSSPALSSSASNGNNNTSSGSSSGGQPVASSTVGMVVGLVVGVVVLIVTAVVALHRFRRKKAVAASDQVVDTRPRRWRIFKRRDPQYMTPAEVQAVIAKLEAEAGTSGDQFSATTLTLGNPQDSDLRQLIGLDDDDFFGSSMMDPVKAMKNEWHEHGSEEDKANWRYVVEGIACDPACIPRHVQESEKFKAAEFDIGHKGWKLQQFLGVGCE